ncbi:hypothetical protein [Hydrogenophaga sp.]|uniref:hypothetical protein n=1 Tax=Hydrogenophaga sp. TaxID=1904254 RepID=UPI0027265805|nr:hypothetical protein [Hydrogenophaga sp.]MDO8906295.1 hypothetical protein [Hydrogenophaga sp.]
MSTPAPTRTWTKTAERPLRSAAKSLGVYLFAHFVGVPVPWRAVRQTDGKSLLAYEHERLLALAAAGEHVPVVVAFDGDTMVTGDVGTTLEHLLHRIPEADRLPLMCAASADLAGFHARGHWHGGAQARNVTWDGHRFARIDFEERLYPGLPLETVQRYDALQLVLSLARFLDPLGPAAVLQVLNAYREAWAIARPEASPAQSLQAFLQPLLPRLRRIARLAALSTRLDGSRELIRLRTVLDGMTQFVSAQEST